METKQTRSGLIFGTILIAIGILLFLGEVVDFLNQADFWPFIVIGVGAAFFAGMILGGKATGPLAIPGSIISGIGLILLVQNVFGWWETWSYSWALIIVFVGLGIAIYGYWSDKPESRKGGWDVARVGLILFLVFGTLFEFIFSFTGVSGRPVSIFFPVLLVVIGVLQFLWRAFRLVTRPNEVQGDGRDLGGPIILSGIGLVAILTVLDLISTSQLLGLLGLWPLLLIFGGIQLIVGRRTPWVGAVMAILLIAVALTLTFAGDRLGIRLSAPVFFVGNFDEGWNGWEQVKGNRETTEKTFSVSDFNEIDLSIPGNLEIVQSNQESLTIVAESNILEYIEVKVRGNELEIDSKSGYRLEPTQDIVFKVTVKTLERVFVSSAGFVTMETLETDQLELNSSGVGNFELADLQSKYLDVNISGSGSAKVAGKVDRVDINISGAGNFTGGDLQTQDANVNISGLGKAVLWVEDNLDTNISGAGTISYYGNPSVNQRTSGAGNVQRLGDK